VIRSLFLSSIVATACLVFSPSRTLASSQPNQPTKPDFSGTWTLDLQGSTSLEPLMQKIGASFVECKLANVIPVKATLHQNGQSLTVATRAPGLAVDEILYFDGRSHPSNIELLGGSTVNSKAVWSKDDQQLIATYEIKTKDGKDGQLIIKRYLMSGAKSEVVVFTLTLNGQPGEISGRQIWNKQS
jgi:hypothetical protein